MKVKDINFFIEEYELASGDHWFLPWITYMEKGVLWGWNSRKHLLCTDPDKFSELSELQILSDLGLAGHRFNTQSEAEKYIESWKHNYDEQERYLSGQKIVNSKIINKYDK